TPEPAGTPPSIWSPVREKRTEPTSDAPLASIAWRVITVVGTTTSLSRCGRRAAVTTSSSRVIGCAVRRVSRGVVSAGEEARGRESGRLWRSEVVSARTTTGERSRSATTQVAQRVGVTARRRLRQLLPRMARDPCGPRAVATEAGSEVLSRDATRRIFRSPTYPRIAKSNVPRLTCLVVVADELDLEDLVPAPDEIDIVGRPDLMVRTR